MADGGHRIRWFVYVYDSSGRRYRLPRQASMRGVWGYDVECSCGWQTTTGGAIRSYVEREARQHKLTACEDDDWF